MDADALNQITRRVDEALHSVGTAQTAKDSAYYSALAITTALMAVLEEVSDLREDLAEARHVAAAREG